MKEKFLKLSENIAKYCFCFFVLLYSIANIFFTFRRLRLDSPHMDAYYLFGINVYNFLFIMMILFFIYVIFHKKTNSKKTIIYFSLFTILLGAIWIISNPLELSELDDSFNCFKAANELANGNLGAIGYKTYINTYPHNLPLVTYFFALIKIFGRTGALWAIRFINLLFVLIGYLCLYEITKLMFNDEKVNSVMVLLMFFSTQFIFYSYLIYSNVLSYSLGMISLLFFTKYIKNNRYIDLSCSLLFVVISAALKNNSLILLVAELIFVFLRLIKKFDYKIISLTVCSFILLTVLSTGIIKFWENRSDSDYSNKLPLSCWIAYGMNYYERNPGGYTNEFEKFHYENDYVTEFTEIQTNQFIKNTLKTFADKPNVMAKFYAQKFLFSFANPEYDAFSGYNEIDQGWLTNNLIHGDKTLNKIVVNAWDAASTLISIGLLFYCFGNKKNIHINDLLLPVCVFGGFLFHAFWETKSIYLYQYFLLLLPFAAKGLSVAAYKIKLNCKGGE